MSDVAEPRLGLSGAIAKKFLLSEITPLLALVGLLMGVFAVLVTPREEEPQINVTFANVFIPFPGATAREVERLVSSPAEQVLAEIEGVEHVYSVSRPGLAVLTVQFFVGEPRTDAIVRLYNKLYSNADWLPANLGVGQPIVKPKGIDDVPIVALTLWTEDSQRGADDLARVAHTLETELKRVPGTRDLYTIGAPDRVVRVRFDPARLSGYGLALSDLRRSLQAANASTDVGALVGDNREIPVQAGSFLVDPEDIGTLVVGLHQGTPVYLADVAEVKLEPDAPERYVWLGTGPAAETSGIQAQGEFPAVTLAIAKKARRERGQDRRPGSRTGRAAQGNGHPGRRRNHRHPQLRRHRQRQGDDPDHQTDFRHRTGDRPGSVRAGLARGVDRRRGGDSDPDDDAVRLLGLGLHPQPGVAVRADFLHRHPGGRCHRGGGEHSPPYPSRRAQAGRGDSAGGGRSRRPDHSGDVYRHRRPAADGFCLRVDGAVHEPDPDQLQHGHVDFAGGGLRVHALADVQGAAAGGGET